MDPLRAISEAFECEVHWYGETKTVHIYSPARAYVVSAEKLAETITDDEGNVLIEAVAYYPVGLNMVTVKGIKKGNAALILAHVKKGEGLESATQIYISSFYVDENNMLTLVTEEDAMFLINK